LPGSHDHEEDPTMSPHRTIHQFSSEYAVLSLMIISLSLSPILDIVVRAF